MEEPRRFKGFVWLMWLSRIASLVFLVICEIAWVYPNLNHCGLTLNCIIGDANSCNGMFGFDANWSPSSPFWLRQFWSARIPSPHPWFPTPTFGGGSMSDFEIPWWLLTAATLLWSGFVWRAAIYGFVHRFMKLLKPDPATAFPVVMPGPDPSSRSSSNLPPIAPQDSHQESRF
jgi:hypothetical protein